MVVSSLNQCSFIGNVGADPYYSLNQHKLAVAKFNLACPTNSKVGDNVDWVPVTLYGSAADTAHSLIKKGDKVYVSGKFTSKKVRRKGVEFMESRVIGDKIMLLKAKQYPVPLPNHYMPSVYVNGEKNGNIKYEELEPNG